MKQGFVIVRDKNNTNFFHTSGSYQRPSWKTLDEATVYYSGDAATAAVKKLWLQGHFSSKIVPLSELHLQFELPVDQQDVCGECNCSPCECGDSQAVSRGSEQVCPNCGEVHDDQQGDDVIDVDGKQFDVADDDQYDDEPEYEESENAYSRTRFLPTQKVKYQKDPNNGYSVVQDAGTGMVYIRGKTGKPFPVNSYELVKEDVFKMPAKPPLDAQPDDKHPVFAPDVKPGEKIKFQDPAVAHDDPETKPTYATADQHCDNVKVPNELKSSLAAAIAQFKQCADYNNGRDDAQASFCMTCHDAFEELADLLDIGTVESIKQAQIKMTSWMNPITINIPAEVRDFVLRGGMKPSLKDLFDMKKGQQMLDKVSKGIK